MDAGYSGTPLAKKLGVKEGARVALVRAPAGFESLLEGLPVGVEFSPEAPSDVVVCFCSTVDELAASLEALADTLTPAGGLWIAWPKKSSGVATDLGDGIVRQLGLATGLVDNKVCAIDGTWSGLRFVRRVKDRER